MARSYNLHCVSVITKYMDALPTLNCFTRFLNRVPYFFERGGGASSTIRRPTLQCSAVSNVSCHISETHASNSSLRAGAPPKPAWCGGKGLWDASYFDRATRVPFTHDVSAQHPLALLYQHSYKHLYGHGSKPRTPSEIHFAPQPYRRCYRTNPGSNITH